MKPGMICEYHSYQQGRCVSCGKVDIDGIAIIGETEEEVGKAMIKVGCKGKKEYNTKQEADQEIFRMLLESCGGVGDLRSYRCKYCSKWHLTSQSR